MKKIAHLLFAALIVSLISCEKDSSIYPEQGQVSGDKVITNDLSLLKNRVTFRDNPALYTFTDPNPEGKGVPAASVTIEVIANLESPVYKNEVLQASHIRINGDYAYIGYNTQGERYLGGVDIVDINPAIDPALISNLIFIDPLTNKGKDVSSVDIETRDGGSKYLWIAGAEEANDTLQSPAVLGKLALNASNQFADTDNPGQYFDLKGYVGTDVRYYNGKVYVTSGTGGGLTVLDNEMNEMDYYDIENARSVDVNKNFTIALGGNPGHLHAPGLWDVSIGGATDPEAKSMVRLCYETHGGIVTEDTKCTGNFALTALGEEGLKCFNLDISNSVPVSSLPRPAIPEECDGWNYVTNGVSVSKGGWVYIANGAGGLDIAKMNLYGKLTWVGNINLGSSVNFVEASDNYVFAATGLGGLKILKITSNQVR